MQRAEDFGSKRSTYRQSYDLVTARAVASLPVLAELCLPLTKKGGYFVAMKGSKGAVELNEAATCVACFRWQIGTNCFINFTNN
jgi:16S rRNA (guanine527-N7)-methyltransferase